MVEGGNPLIMLGETRFAHGALLGVERAGDHFTSRGRQT